MSRHYKRERGARIDFTEEAILVGIQQGDHDAFTSLYSQSFNSLVNTSHNYVKDIEVAKEIVQNIFLRLLEAPPHIVNSRALKAYLHRAAINHSINHLKRERRLIEHHNRIALNFIPIEEESFSEDNTINIKLRDAIDKLPPKCQKILKMSRYQNLKYREIAEQLGIAEKTVENHIVSAFKILRRKFTSKNHAAKLFPCE